MFGELEITSIDRNGNRFAFVTPNTITLKARELCSKVIVGLNVPNIKVSKLAVGTGTTPPTRNDVALQTKVDEKSVDEILFPADGQIELVTTLDFVCPANGKVLTEAGLMTADGTSLFARQIHTGTRKDDDIRLEYRWRIVFT